MLLLKAGAATAVDTSMAALPMLSDPLNVASTVREVYPALCDELDVVTPEVMRTVQNVFLLSKALAVCSTIAAPVVDDPRAVAVNAVVPQPIVAGVGSVPHTKLGSTSVIWSPIVKSAFAANEKPISDAAEVTGLLIVRMLCVNTGSAIAVDSIIGVADTS
jgi:hypothetical protein